MGANGYNKRGARSKRKLGLERFLGDQGRVCKENKNKVQGQIESIPIFLPKYTPRPPIPLKKEMAGKKESDVSFPIRYKRVVKEISFEDYLKSIGKSGEKK
jgi:hypothetical protein